MMKRTNLFKLQSCFLGCWAVLISALAIAIATTGKPELHLLFNQYTHSEGLDVFFKYFTKLAEYSPYILIAVLVVVALIKKEWRYAILSISSQLLVTAIVQVTKHIVNAPRPKTYFTENYPDMIGDLHWVEGVKMHSQYSFPSGHTASFFSVFFLLSIILTEHIHLADKKADLSVKILIELLCFLIAVVGSYSRLYLSQHFASDVLAGAIIGVVATIVCHYIVSQYSKQH